MILGGGNEVGKAPDGMQRSLQKHVDKENLGGQSVSVVSGNDESIRG